ncbi:MAG TPA: winged helix-turn-helix domain-containing protein, partial [Methanomassiliicoccales archaeon]|nr:winged helix-turn-helix domain-containing protein [Methanomassiliicoccales archaeon]
MSQLLTDPYAVKILVATVRAPKCAQDISDQFGIPIAACYRRIRDLEKFGLIVCTERKLSRQGKRVAYYVSLVKTAHVFYEEGRLKVKFEMKDGSYQSRNDGWHNIELDKDSVMPPEDRPDEEDE